MADAVRMWAVFAGASIRSQMQYRASFLIGAFGQLVITGVDFLALWALFDRFGSLQGWSLPEIALFYGVAHVAFALCDMVAGGFEETGTLIRRGQLDRVLLRPRTTVLQLLGHTLELRRLGRLIQGLAVFVWAVWQLDVAWSAADVVLLAASLACGAMLFLGLFVFQATMSIWTVQALEIVNATTYGGVYSAQHPLPIYTRWFRWFFVFVVPLGCVTYYPLLVVMERADPLGGPAWLGWVTPLAGPLFLALAILAWCRGVRRYASTGS